MEGRLLRHPERAGSLMGAEWVVDSVSRGGQHKVVALWRYDKGSANGAPFVYSPNVKKHTSNPKISCCGEPVSNMTGIHTSASFRMHSKTSNSKCTER